MIFGLSGVSLTMAAIDLFINYQHTTHHQADRLWFRVRFEM